MAQPHWVKANFHAHAASDLARDDGAESPKVLHEAVRARGFAFSVHSLHSTVNTSAQAAAQYRAQADKEAHLGLAGITTLLGEELTVQPGPRWQRRTSVLGREAPGNLDHVTVFGNQEYIPNLTPLAEACTRAHDDGGLCLVNHPGPGPMMWEDGWWEAACAKAKPAPLVDGLEVYNGQAVTGIGLDFEERYREATAYRGLGLKLAAVSGTDTHGPHSVERARSRLTNAAGGAGRLLRMFLPGSGDARPELDVATLVLADSNAIADVVAALKVRRTVATFAMGELTVELPGLGEVKHTAEVALAATFSRKLAEVTLYEEGVAVKTWNDVDRIAWNEHLSGPAAFVIGARDGQGRLLTSAIWYEPK